MSKYCQILKNREWRMENMVIDDKVKKKSKFWKNQNSKKANS